MEQYRLKMFNRGLTLALCLVTTVSCLSQAQRPRLDVRKVGDIIEPHRFSIGMNKVHIDPNGQVVRVDWKGFNVLTGNSFRPPFQELMLSTKLESYQVTESQPGSRGLSVNGTNYDFDWSSQQLLIRFGSGISIEPVGDVESAVGITAAELSKLR